MSGTERKMQMRKFALVAALAAVLTSAAGAAAASAAVFPAPTSVTMASSSATWLFGTSPVACSSGMKFTTSSTWPNSAMGLTGDTTPNVRFSSCSPSTTVSTSSGWTISFFEDNDASAADESSTALVIVWVPKGTTFATGAGCTYTITSDATWSGAYADGSTSLSLSGSGMSYTGAGFFCQFGSSGNNLRFSGTYTLSTGLTVK